MFATQFCNVLSPLMNTIDSAILILEYNLQYASAKVCPQYCISDGGFYMTCPSSGSQQLQPPCNCCFAPSGCQIFGSDGTLYCTGT
ncbi:UNVERIFIED_CONTAM: hypothetical protein Sradi_5205800 [Sesamum radiatum]|uniref:Uncharacterized protein n=1 Tax=Sesamum radiatum TaxID=300843 RepID=A0AAW2M735_SESRA